MRKPHRTAHFFIWVILLPLLGFGVWALLAEREVRPVVVDFPGVEESETFQ